MSEHDHQPKSYEELARENEALRTRLEEADELVNAIRTGAVDALVVTRSQGDEQVYTLEGADRPYRSFVEAMNEGAVTLSSDGTILYCNRLFADLAGRLLKQTLGARFQDFVMPADRPAFAALFEQANTVSVRGEVSLAQPYGVAIPVRMSIRRLPAECGQAFCLVITDLRGQKAQAALMTRTRQQQVLYDLSSAVNRSEPLTVLYEKALDAMLRSLDTDRASIFLTDQEGGMRLTAWRGLSADCRKAVEGYSSGIPDERNPVPVVIEHLAEAKMEPDLRRILEREGIESLAIFPLAYVQVMVGQFMVYFNKVGHLDEPTIQAAQAIAGTLALGIERARGEAALRESEERLRAALDAGGTGTFRWNLQTNAVEWDRSLDALFGLPPGSTVQTLEGFFDLVHPDDRAEVQERCRRCLEDGAHFDMEFRVIWPDGSLHWIDDKANIVGDAMGVPLYMTGACVDVTERKAAEAALRETEARLRLALESAQIGIWDVDLLTGDSRWDPRCREFLGLPPGNEVSYEMFVECLHPDDRASVEEAVMGALDSAGEGKCDIEYRTSRQNGGLERWIRAMGRAVFEGQGGVRQAIRMTGTLLDITQQKLADESLRESEKRLRLALEAGRMGAWDIDLRTNTTTWDSKEFQLLDFPAGSVEPSGELFYSRVHPDDVPDMKRLVHEALGTGRLQHEFRVVLSGGQVRWLATMGQILKDDRGEPVRMVGVNFDVTDRKEAEERLRLFASRLEELVEGRTGELLRSQDQLRALATELNLAEQRERTRLAADLHDHLAQLLVLIRLKLGQVKRVTGIPEKCAGLIQETESVLTECLSYTRTLVADLSPPVLHEFGLGAALKWLARQMERYDVTVTVVLDELNQAVLPDDQSVLVFQSVRELLMNVSKHAGADQATVSLEQRNGHLQIQVRDAGRGFHPSALGETHAANGISAKFGLFSIRERMKALCGRFELDSAPGSGTTATLTLPLPLPLPGTEARGEGISARGNAEALSQPGASLPHASRLSPSASTKIRVLLVDDHVMVRQGLRSVLDSYADVEVVGEAADGEEAVASVDRLQPSIVVMDINMPRKNGIEATAEIKARDPEVIIIGLSVNTAGDLQAAMLQAGAAMLLTKEAAVEELYAAIVAQITARQHV
jgi:PAS domain S-box-containing protein